MITAYGVLLLLLFCMFGVSCLEGKESKDSRVIWNVYIIFLEIAELITKLDNDNRET